MQATGTVMAAGPSRLTPGLIRVGPSGAMRDVDPERAHVGSIPAWSRLDGMCHDGSDGSIEKIVSDVGAGITKRLPLVRRVYIEPQSVEQHEEDLQEIRESPSALDPLATPA